MSKNMLNEENYQKTIIQEDINTYIITFNKIINRFLDSSIDNVYMKDDNYLKYILLKGINTVLNVFNFLILYTKNIELINIYCEKSYLYYIEFIGQIGHESQSYLQLNSKDAILFVYKKTICDINNEYRKTFEIDNIEKDILHIINLINNIINTYRGYMVMKYDFSENTEESIGKIKENIYTIMNSLLFIIQNLNDKNKKLDIIFNFMKNIECKDIEINKYVALCESFCKKIKKKDIENRNIISKINSNLFDKNINSMTNLKFINWLIS
jgi:hypothetical protein